MYKSIWKGKNKGSSQNKELKKINYFYFNLDNP